MTNNQLCLKSILIGLIAIIIVIYGFTVFGKTLETNKNKVTEFFNEKIDDKAALEAEIADIKNKSQSGIESKSALENLGTTESAANAEAGRIDAIPAESLGTEGQKIRYKEENQHLESMYIDYSDKQILNHKKDTDLIADASAKFMENIKSGLAKEGVDCKIIKGDKDIEPEYFIDVQKQAQKDTIYNQKICEEARSKYKCTDSLTVNCKNVGYVAGKLTNVTGNLVHTIDYNGLLSLGVASNGYYFNSLGSQMDFIFTFDVDNPVGIESFLLKHVYWSDHLLVKLNDKIIFQSNGVNGKLEMSTTRMFRGIGFYGVDIGIGHNVSANTKDYFSRNPNIEAKKHLKKGQNTLHIRMVYGNTGALHAKFSFKEKKCNDWIEDWSEKCVLK